MLELGTLGSSGGPGVAVLQDGAAVASLHFSPWRRKSVTAVVAGREWAYTARGRELTGRLTAEPEGTARLRAWPTSWWRIKWAVELDGAVLEVQGADQGPARRFLRDSRVVAVSGRAGDGRGRPTLSAVDGVPLDHQVFLLWVGTMLDGRYSGGATGEGGSDDGGGGD